MKILITAGPTREKIDDVRFISNYSSGKMGYALANYAKELNHEVYLISGPVNLSAIEGVNTIKIESADQMHNEVVKLYKEMDVLIFAAAVADFKPINYHQGKIKKTEDNDKMIIELTKNPDILADISSKKSDNQIVVGFALESENEIENAISKLKRKKCDLIVLNSANKPNSGFDGDYNTITLIDINENIEEFPPMLKQDCSKVIFEKIFKLINKG